MKNKELTPIQEIGLEMLNRINALDLRLDILTKIVLHPDQIQEEQYELAKDDPNVLKALKEAKVFCDTHHIENGEWILNDDIKRFNLIEERLSSLEEWRTNLHDVNKRTK